MPGIFERPSEILNEPLAFIFSDETEMISVEVSRRCSSLKPVTVTSCSSCTVLSCACTRRMRITKREMTNTFFTIKIQEIQSRILLQISLSRVSVSGPCDYFGKLCANEIGRRRLPDSNEGVEKRIPFHQCNERKIRMKNSC